MPQLGPPRQSLLSNFRGRNAEHSPSKRQSLVPQCEEDVDRPPESSSSSGDEDGEGESNGSGLVGIDIDTETPRTKAKGKTYGVIKTGSTLARTTRGSERAVTREGRNVSSPRSDAPSSGMKRKREALVPSTSQPARPPSPTKEEEALFSQPKSQLSMYGSQRSSQGYLSQPKSGHGQRRQTEKNLHAEAATREGSRKRKFKPPLGQDAIPSSSPAAPIFKRSAIALVGLPSNKPPSLNITGFRRTELSPRRSTSTAKREFKRQPSHSSSLSEPASPDAQQKLGVPSETYEQQLQALGAAPEHIDFISSNLNEVSCPICGTAVSKPFYDSFTAGRQLGYSRAMDFCAAHKAQTAELRLAKSSYPTIDWDNFDTRLDRFHDNLESLLTGRTPSTYRQDLEAKVATGKSRAAMRNPEAADAAALTGSVGYYGGRGASRMTEHILRRFGRRIREVAQTDGLFAEVGVPGFVRGVLVPELAVLLVMEDSDGCGGERAREILEESAEMGELWEGETDGGEWVGERRRAGKPRDSGVGCGEHAEWDERDLSPASSSGLSLLSDEEWAILDDAPERTRTGKGPAPMKRTTRSGPRPEVISLHDD